MRQIFYIFILFAVVIGITASSVFGLRQGSEQRQEKMIEQNVERQIQDPNNVSQTTIDGYNKFGFDIFRQLISHRDDGNLIISPVSISTALAMTMNGASGTTRKEMETALNQSGIDLAQLDKNNAELLKSLQSADPSVTLSIANSIWARNGVNFKRDFLNRDQEFFKAQISTLDFGDPRSLATINNWVAQNTGNKIEKIVDRLTPESVMMLINAVYFKGKWQNEFKKSDTAPGDFRLHEGNTIKVQMMSQSGRYLYQKGDSWQAVSLPYGNGRFGLYVFLPEPERCKDCNDPLANFLATLNQDPWNKWMAGFRKQPGSIKIPRFKLQSDENLIPSLRNLGIVNAFDPEHADFSAMSADENLYIQTVKHKSVIEVNEEGTEAAAATSVGVATTSAIMQPQPPFEFIADHPFFVAIRDNQTGALLFIGTVSNPQ